MRISIYTLSLSLVILNFTHSQSVKNWTIMHYAAGSNSSERDLMSDVEEMKRGKLSDDYNFVLLIDRIEGFSEDSLTLDGNFNDTRMYEISESDYIRIEGEEFFPSMRMHSSFDANMSDAETLKRFVQFCKIYYPARNYMLILRSHGNGIGMCPDSEHGTRDRIYVAELSDVLDNNESVDILGLDVCSMAGLENLYQWRPGDDHFSADYVIASAPLSGAWAYDEIMSRLTSESEDGSHLDPNVMSARDLSLLFYDEILQNQQWASWGLFDNTVIQELKTAIDEASHYLQTEDDERMLAIIERTLGYYHNTNEDMELAQLSFPYLDAFHFWQLISEEISFSEKVRVLARGVCDLIDDLVVRSYYGRGYLPVTTDFVEGSSGIYQIIPQGKRIFTQSGQSFWSHCRWFHPEDMSSDQSSYGNYDWCRDSAIQGNGMVENFFEYLDHLFDLKNDQSGGVNKYRY